MLPSYGQFAAESAELQSVVTDLQEPHRVLAAEQPRLIESLRPKIAKLRVRLVQPLRISR